MKMKRSRIPLALSLCLYMVAVVAAAPQSFGHTAAFHQQFFASGSRPLRLKSAPTMSLRAANLEAILWDMDGVLGMWPRIHTVAFNFPLLICCDPALTFNSRYRARWSPRCFQQSV
jgi:hypothetical protein